MFWKITCRKEFSQPSAAIKSIYQNCSLEKDIVKIAPLKKDTTKIAPSKKKDIEIALSLSKKKPSKWPPQKRYQSYSRKASKLFSREIHYCDI